jgi:hypothetical protein
MRLTRDSPIDIYRARLPGGTRLVVSTARAFLLPVFLILPVFHRRRYGVWKRSKLMSSLGHITTKAFVDSMKSKVLLPK